MRAARFAEYGGPEVLRVEQAPEPHPARGAIRIRVQTAAVNPLDVLARRGDLRRAMPLDLPAIPGRDAAGTVDELGADVRDVAVGDVVFGLGCNVHTYAEYAVLTTWAQIPPTWSMSQAAAAGLAVTTALHAIDAVAPPGNATLLVGGVAGSVGAAAAAIALDRGYRVIGTARPVHHDHLRRLGIAPVAYGPGLAARVAEFAPPGDLYAVDTFGSDALDALVDIVGNPTRVATVCDPAGAARLGTHMVYGENDPHALALAADLGTRGRYAPRIGQTFTLDEAGAAHQLMENGHTDGKIVINVTRTEGGPA